MDDLTREPDPDCARLPDDYGEEDGDGVVVYTYEGPDTVKRMMLLTRYHEARGKMQGKWPVVGARRPEPEEVEAMRQELLLLGVVTLDSENLAGGAV